MQIEPCRDAIARYMDVVFSYCEGLIPLRSFAEKGGDARKPVMAWVENDAGAIDKVFAFAQGANERRMACYCIPGTVAEHGKAGAADIRQMQTLLADIDTGDAEAKLAQATGLLGQPSLIVESGGITETGQRKLHLYWKLSEPVEGNDLQKLVQLRHALALKIDADTHFKSAHQPIRIAGSVYHKTEPLKMVMMRGHYDA